MGLLARGDPALSTLDATWLGRVPYAEALDLQARLHERRSRGEVGDTLLLLEHPHVYTIGRRGSRDDVRWDDATLAARGVELVEADRGGMVTYHGPGQLVGYPIVDLGAGCDLVEYVRNLEEALIRTLAGLGLEGGRVEGRSGVWVGESKIAAVGVRITRGITKHGFAINVSTDLGYFAGIVPCGITDRGVTSIQAEGVATPAVAELADPVARHLADVLGLRLRTLEAVA